MEEYSTPLRNKNRGYMRLIVWQKALQLFELAWRLAFVEAKIDFKLRAQFVDAAQSVSSTISEGYGRRSFKEYIQFLYIALGSMAETMTRDIGFARTSEVVEARFREFDALPYEAENRLLKLIEKLQEKRDEGNWTARIAEDPSEFMFEPPLHDSTTPPLHHSPHSDA